MVPQPSSTSDYSCYSKPSDEIDLGEFQSPSRGVNGRVSIINSKIIKIYNFTYDGISRNSLFFFFFLFFFSFFLFSLISKQTKQPMYKKKIKK